MWRRHSYAKVNPLLKTVASVTFSLPFSSLMRWGSFSWRAKRAMGRQVFFPFLMTRHSLGSMRQRSRPLKAEARRQPHLEGEAALRGGGRLIALCRLVVLQSDGSWVRGELDGVW